jgi:cobalamin biosynthesis Mg chelatase CobN
LVVVGVRVFPYLPNKFFDLFTFEAKPAWAVDVTAVYEALAHRRAATHSFVVLHVPTDKAEGLQPAVDAIVAEAERHGVGVIVAADPSDYESWDVLVEAERVEPDPEALNDFIAVQLSPAAKDEIATWVR